MIFYYYYYIIHLFSIPMYYLILIHFLSLALSLYGLFLIDSKKHYPIPLRISLGSECSQIDSNYADLSPRSCENKVLLLLLLLISLKHSYSMYYIYLIGSNRNISVCYNVLYSFFSFPYVYMISDRMREQRGEATKYKGFTQVLL